MLTAESVINIFSINNPTATYSSSLTITAPAGSGWPVFAASYTKFYIARSDNSTVFVYSFFATSSALTHEDSFDIDVDPSGVAFDGYNLCFNTYEPSSFLPLACYNAVERQASSFVKSH